MGKNKGKKGGKKPEDDHGQAGPSGSQQPQQQKQKEQQPQQHQKQKDQPPQQKQKEQQPQQQQAKPGGESRGKKGGNKPEDDHGQAGQSGSQQPQQQKQKEQQPQHQKQKDQPPQQKQKEQQQQAKPGGESRGKKKQAREDVGDFQQARQQPPQRAAQPPQQQAWRQQPPQHEAQPPQQHARRQQPPQHEAQPPQQPTQQQQQFLEQLFQQARRQQPPQHEAQPPQQQAGSQQPPQQAAQPPQQHAWRQQPPQQAAQPPQQPTQQQQQFLEQLFQQARRQQPPQHEAQPPQQQAWRQQPPQQAAQPPQQQARRQQPPQQEAQPPQQQAWRQQPPQQAAQPPQQPTQQQQQFLEQQGERVVAGRGKKGRGRGVEFPGQPIPATRGFVSPSESPVHQPFDTSQTIKGLEQKPAQAPPPKAQKEATPPTPLGKEGRGRGVEFPDQPIPATRGFVSPSESPVHQPFDTSQTIKGLEQKPAQAPPPKAQKEATPPTPLGKDDTSVKSITTGISNLALIPKRKTQDRPAKEGHGRKIQVETNHLALRMKNTSVVVYHYDVAITPDKPFKFYRPAMNEVQKTYYPNQFPAFDGKKNLYSYSELPIQRQVLHAKVEVWDAERSKVREMEVQIKMANSINFATIGEYLRSGTSLSVPQEAIQALDVVLRSPASNSFVPVGRSYFSPPPGQLIQLGGGLDLWYGFYQSAILGWKPFLNIDVAHKGFPTAKNCIEILKDLSEQVRSQLDPNYEPDRRALNDFKSFIKNLRIAYEIQKGGSKQKRTYKVLDLSTCPRNNRFKTDSGPVTVEEYFRREYNYRINYPLVPCIECGSKEKPISLPMELCRVLEGQVVNKKLNEMQTRNMVRAAAVGTDIRKRKIENSIRSVAFNNDPCIKEFGIFVDTNFTNVEARILDAPRLLYKQSERSVDKGVWKSGRFLKADPLSRWAILNTDRRVGMNKLQDLFSSLQRNGKELGMEIDNPIIVVAERPNEVENHFKAWKDKGIQLAVIILPDRGITYAKVKQIAEQQVGVLTQCLKSRTLEKLSPSTVTNILLKINSKHNGINHNIKCSVWEKYFNRPVIVFGADVTHPSPGQDGVPSVAAVAASYEPKAFAYNMEWRFQPPREEMICDLEEIVKKQLLEFYNRTNGLKPEKIFFYRDGVSEGQFKKVLDVELQAIRRACKGLGGEYQPSITFLVVQKRHHTRFFPQAKDADGRNKNVPAGTVVDTTITHINEIDFYLVSHASIQGTSRPTKYHVLWDDSNMSEDDIEELTYYLCHLFTRCTRAVSYPAPTYYAHLAAFRIRSYYEDQAINLNSLKKEESKMKVREEFVKKSPMFFI
ncbi:protein argonaute-2-like isoform X3 [Rhodnius prolixus]|uniref:protein argonaute-2-like isoform X3 n=1 Tax=Rhodnius prolixus TaxID=13249 RepID=UPI003D18E78D